MNFEPKFVATSKLLRAIKEVVQSQTDEDQKSRKTCLLAALSRDARFGLTPLKDYIGVEVPDNAVQGSHAREVMAKAGWRYHSAGAFGAVYVRDDQPFVVKIFRKTDVGYRAFVEHVFKSKPNKHYPKFAVNAILDVNLHLNAVLVERLYPLPGDKPEMFDTVEALADYMYGIDLRKIRRHKDDSYIGRPLWVKSRNQGKWLLGNDPALFRAAVGVARLIKDDITSDIGSSNVMQRNTPEGPVMVFTDPLC